MRERLARAAALELYAYCGEDMDVRFPSDCSLDDTGRARYRGLMAAVDAILAELEKPTQEMREAMAEEFHRGSGYLPESFVAAIHALIPHSKS